ncbi:sensor domain-containing diguanylate cyclase [Butyrivibrio sp. AE2032]|uniref:sensor domain-containing diguanylate cyclase n=1 Tax=Butyrivibrio sp. AE2032 TaxID=1458463 RepID=UPI00054D8300|nr:sensor domain-containing diguanylate cyclase [Butyrivibrio sp. AE2032]
MRSTNSKGKIGYASEAEFSASDILYMLKDLPDPCCIFKVLTDPFGTVKDMLFLFVNEKYAKMTGKTTAELVGSTFYSTVSNQDEDWIRFSYQAAILRQSSINRTYNSQLDKWFEFWAVPVYRKGFCAYIIHDVTADKRDEEDRIYKSNTNELVIECAKAVSTSDFNKGMKRVLKKIGQTIEADRVYVVRTKDAYSKDFYEWVSKSSANDFSAKKVFEQYDLSAILTKRMGRDNSFYMNDTASIMDKYPELYTDHLAGRCSRFIVAKLKDKDELMGFLIAVNYKLELHMDMSLVMETVAAFISSQIKNHELHEELMYLGGHDALTGLGNRYSLNETVKVLSELSSPVGVCYADINGLKTINDDNGHEAGDKIICSMATVFSSVFKKKYCFRIGGDEFIAIVPEIEKDKFEELVNKLKAKDKDKTVAIGHVWAKDSSSLSKLIQKADEAMYKDKATYYKAHERRHSS